MSHLRIDSCDFVENQGGAVKMLTVGEAGPRIKLTQLRLDGNGIALLNLTGPAGITLRLSNTPWFSVTNCLITHHKGDALRIALYADQVTKGIRGNITNNVFLRNHLGSVLLAEGRLKFL